MKKKTNSFTSRPEPPTLAQIAEDIANASDNDPVFNRAYYNNERSSEHLQIDQDNTTDPLEQLNLNLESSTPTEPISNCYLNRANEYIKQIKELRDLHHLNEINAELELLSGQLIESQILQEENDSSDETEFLAAPAKPSHVTVDV